MRSELRPGPSLARALLFAGGLAALWAGSAACELGDGDCLRMSDCDVGYVCVEGTCRSNVPSDAPADVAARPHADAASDIFVAAPADASPFGAADATDVADAAIEAGEGVLDAGSSADAADASDAS